MKINESIASIQHGKVLILNNSTARIITVTVAPDEPEEKFLEIYLSVEQTNDLLQALAKMTWTPGSGG